MSQDSEKQEPKVTINPASASEAPSTGVVASSLVPPPFRFGKKLSPAAVATRNHNLDLEEEKQDPIKMKLINGAKAGDVAIVEEALRKGAGIADLDRHGKSALQYACENKNKDMIRYLVDKIKLEMLEKGGVSSQGSGLMPALLRACKDSEVEIAEMLITTIGEIRENINAPFVVNEHGTFMKPLVEAAHSECIKIVKLLLDAGANINDSGKEGYTALHASVRNKSTEIASLLINRGADLEPGRSNGNTPLGDAAMNGNIDSVNLLVRSGANVNRGSKVHEYVTPLYFASSLCSDRSKSLEVVKYLLSKGVVLDTKDTYGQTPLHNAILCRNTGAAKALINAGCDLNIRDKNGKTPLVYAMEKNQKEVIDKITNPQAAMGTSELTKVWNQVKAGTIAVGAWIVEMTSAGNLHKANIKFQHTYEQKRMEYSTGMINSVGERAPRATTQVAPSSIGEANSNLRDVPQNKIPKSLERRGSFQEALKQSRSKDQSRVESGIVK